MTDLGTLTAAGDRMTLRFERRFAHPIERVWPQVSTASGLERWFPARVEIDSLEVGGGMTFHFSEADIQRARDAGVEDVPLTSSGVITAIEPPRLFAFEWLGEPIRIELVADGDGCRLLFTHEFASDPVQAPKNGAGWHQCLDALAASLAGSAAPDDRHDELERRYAEALTPA